MFHGVFWNWHSEYGPRSSTLLSQLMVCLCVAKPYYPQGDLVGKMGPLMTTTPLEPAVYRVQCTF